MKPYYTAQITLTQINTYMVRVSTVIIIHEIAHILNDWGVLHEEMTTGT